jgi:hypothetical protein
MKQVRCCNSKCNKVVGEIEKGKARFKCKHCGTYTTVEIEHTKPAPPGSYQTCEIGNMEHVPINKR